MSRLFARARREESGAAMIIAVILSSVVATLSILMLSVGLHTDKATSRGRHFVQSLHVAESGVEEAIGKIEGSGGDMPSTTWSGTTELGAYDVTLTRLSRNRYRIQSTGGVRAGRELGAERTLRVMLEPPISFDKALFSYTTVETKNNDIIDGDVWGNHNVILAIDTQVTGSVVAATGYVNIGPSADVGEDAWSGGFDTSNNYAIYIDQNATVGGDATASVVTVECAGADNATYKIRLRSGSVVGGDATTWGALIESSGTIIGSQNVNTCTQAQPAEDLPTFTFAESNYASVQYFGTPSTPSATAITDFQAVVAGLGNRISGTFYINQATPVGQNTRVDLTNVVITGDTTIVTNTPVFTNNTTDDAADAIFTLVSLYDPPPDTSCDVNQDASECSIHLKNNFQATGNTAVVIYAPYGPVAIKNNAEQFGAIYADGIQIKNNQTMTYDARVERVVGFGDVTYEVTKWEEIVSP